MGVPGSEVSSLPIGFCSASLMCAQKNGKTVGSVEGAMRVRELGCKAIELGRRAVAVS